MNIHRSGVPSALFGCYMAGATQNCCRLGAFCVHHTTGHAPSHVTSCEATDIGRVHACLAVTCHLHFWQNYDRDLFTYFCVNKGVERTPKKSQHRKLTLEKKILPPLLPGLVLFEARTERFQNKVNLAGSPPSRSLWLLSKV